MHWRPAALIMAAILVTTSCSGDDDAAATTVASTTTGVPATTAAPSTIDASTTIATTTADPTTTTTTTTTTGSPATTTARTVTATTPPSTGDVEPVDERFAVLEAVEAASQAIRDAVRDPWNDDKVAALDMYLTGPQLEGWRNIVEDYRENNLRQIENTDEPDAILVELASLAVSQAATSATMQACSITSGIVVEVGGNADGSDLIVEDRIGRNVVEIEAVREAGRWKLQSVRSPAEDEWIASCD